MNEAESDLCAVPVDAAGNLRQPEDDAIPDKDLEEMFHISRPTHLAHADGNWKVVVVGVEYNVAHAVQQAFSTAAVPSTEEEISGAVVDVTVAGDGGPVRRRTLTVFTFTVSTRVLRGGRTPLIPIVFLLGGENAIQSALTDRLREQVRLALVTPYATPRW